MALIRLIAPLRFSQSVNRVLGVSLAWSATVVPFSLVVSQATQSPPQLRLPPVSGRSGHEFQQVAAIRELADGRVLVLDRFNTEAPLILVDFTARTATTIGRFGSGPGEYRRPMSLVPLGGDSSLVTDDALRRWLVLSGETIVDHIPTDREPARAVGFLLYGGDSRSQVLSVRAFKSAEPMQMTVTWHAESTFAIRGDISRRRADTLARLRGGAARMQRVQLIRPGADINPTHLLPNPLVVADQALLFPDGWIAVAHFAPYRVEWLSPQGRWTQGGPLPLTRIRVTETERRAAMERRFEERGRATATSVFNDWPEELPPYLDDALLAMPSGHLLIRRTPVSGTKAGIYDIIDRRGLLTATMRVAADERIVGFGARAMYVSVTNEDDVAILQRRPLPTVP